jgi:uncharacterized membrane protein YhaH (DUF805 family)
MKEFLELFFSFKGRVRPRHFWLVNVPCIVVIWMCAAWMMEQPTADVLWSMPEANLDARLRRTIIVFLWILSAGWLSLASSVRRLHDLDMSGWWYLISFIPIIGLVILFIFLGFFPSKPDNKYGPAIIDDAPEPTPQPSEPSQPGIEQQMVAQQLRQSAPVESELPAPVVVEPEPTAEPQPKDRRASSSMREAFGYFLLAVIVGGGLVIVVLACMSMSGG